MRPLPPALLPLLIATLTGIAVGASPAHSIQIVDTRVYASWSDADPGLGPGPGQVLLEDEGALAAEVGSVDGSFGGIGNGARASVAAGTGSLRLAARAAANTSSYDDPHAPPLTTTAQARIDFTVASPTHYVLSASGSNLRVENVGGQQDGVEINLSNGAWYTAQYGAFRSGSFVQPFGASASGVLATGDHELSVFVDGSANVPFSVDDQGNPFVDGASFFDSGVQVILGLGSAAEAIDGGGTLVFDAAVSGTTTSSYTTTTDLAGLLSTQAAASIDFVLSGSVAQVWEIDFTGELDGLATLQLAYDESLLDVAERQLAIRHYDADTGEWEFLHGVVDQENDLITFETASFSPFVLATVPEPGTATLLGLGLGILSGGSRSRRRRRIRHS